MASRDIESRIPGLEKMVYSTYLQNHTAKLCGKHQLLAFTYQRINNEMFSHVCLI